MVARRRRYDRQFKAEVVADAERTNLTTASETHGVALSTLKYWYEHPEFADVRAKTREEVGQGSVVLALVAQGELVRRVRSGNISDQALVAAYGVAIDKAQLLLGGATARSENRDITGTISDAELVAAIREADRIASGAGVEAAPADEAQGER